MDEKLQTDLADNQSVNVGKGVLFPVQLSPLDFRSGGVSAIIFAAENKTKNWNAYRGTKERQSAGFFDSMACVTFSALNLLEMKINFRIKNGLVPEKIMAAFINLGFIDENGNFNCSDRFTAYMSGTTKEGNYFTKVWDSIRNDGLVPEKDWPMPKFSSTDPDKMWLEYYAKPPQALIDKAKLFKPYMRVLYEWVYTGATVMNDTYRALIEKHLEQSPLQIAAAVCGGWSSDTPVNYCNRTATEHATVITNVNDDNTFDDFDHYNPFEKKLAADYCMPYVLKAEIEFLDPQEEEQAPQQLLPAFNTSVAIVWGQRSTSVKNLQIALIQLGLLDKSLATGFFYTKTQAALRAFQAKYAVASPAELKAVDGKRAGVKTLVKINQILNLK